MTVGDIRKAIEGLPDEAFVTLMAINADTIGDETLIFLDLIGVQRNEDRLMIQIDVQSLYLNDDDFDDPDDFKEED